MADGSKGVSKKRQSEGMATPVSKSGVATAAGADGGVVTPTKSAAVSPASASASARKDRQRRSGSPVFVPPTSGRRSRKQTRARIRAQQHRHRAAHRLVASPVASSPSSSSAAAAKGTPASTSSGRHQARRPATAIHQQGASAASHNTRVGHASNAVALRHEATPPRRKSSLHRQESEDDAASIRAGFSSSSTTPRHRPRRRTRINQVVQPAPTPRTASVSCTHSDDTRAYEQAPATAAESTHRKAKTGRRRLQRDDGKREDLITTDGARASPMLGDSKTESRSSQDKRAREPDMDSAIVHVDMHVDDDDDDDDDDDLPSVFGPPRPRSRHNGTPDTATQEAVAPKQQQQEGGREEAKQEVRGSQTHIQESAIQKTLEPPLQQERGQERDQEGEGRHASEPTTQALGASGAEDVPGGEAGTGSRGGLAAAHRNAHQESNVQVGVGKENREPRTGVGDAPCKPPGGDEKPEAKALHSMDAGGQGGDEREEEMENGTETRQGKAGRRHGETKEKAKGRRHGETKEKAKQSPGQDESRSGDIQPGRLAEAAVKQGKELDEESADGELKHGNGVEEATGMCKRWNAEQERARESGGKTVVSQHGGTEPSASGTHQDGQHTQQPSKKAQQSQKQQRQRRQQHFQRSTQEDSEEGMGTPPLFSQLPDTMAGLVSPSATLNSTMQPTATLQPTATATATATAREGTASPTQQTVVGSSTQHVSTEPTSDTPRISLHPQAQLNHPFRVQKVDVLSSEEGVVVAAWCANAIAVWRQEQAITHRRHHRRVHSPITLAFHQQFEPDEEEVKQVLIVSHQTIFFQPARGALRAVDVQKGDVFEVSLPGVTLGNSQSFDEDSHTLLHERVHYGRVCTVHNDEMTGRVGGCVFTWSDARRCAVAPVTLHDRRSADPCTALHVGKAEAGLRNCDLIFAQCEDSMFVWRASDGSALGRLHTHLSQLLVPKDVLALPTSPVLLHVRVGAAPADAQQQVALRESDSRGGRGNGTSGHGEEEEEELGREEGRGGLLAKRARRTRQPLQTCLQATMFWITSADTGAVAVATPAQTNRQEQPQPRSHATRDGGSVDAQATLLRPIARTESVLDIDTMTWLRVSSCPTLALSFQSPSMASQPQRHQCEEANSTVTSAFIHGRLLLSFFKTSKVVVSCTDTWDVVHEQQLHAETGGDAAVEDAAVCGDVAVVCGNKTATLLTILRQ